MSSPPERPILRIVRAGEEQSTAQEAAPERSSVAVPQPTPSTGLLAFRDAIQHLDVLIPRHTALLACAGEYLADQALSFHNQAIAHAPAGTFRRDISPGLKSVEATRAWLQTHVDEMKKAARLGMVTKPYERSEDLQQAAALAGAELDRATSVANVSGLSFDKRAHHAFVAATDYLNKRLAEAPLNVIRAAPEGYIETETDNAFVLGIDVLGACC